MVKMLSRLMMLNIRNYKKLKNLDIYKSETNEKLN